MMLRDLHANSRLQEVLTLWHKCAETYEDPDQFRTFLNACIQAVRNVTFVLQKQKSKIEGFDDWYSEWQEFLKTDEIMKWCVQARNQIVKVGDLKKHSVAIVSYVASYLDSPQHTFEVSPFSNSVEIAHHVTINLLPEELRDTGFLRIERRWVSNDFPDTELLEILAYAFVILERLLLDVEKREGPDFSGLKKDIQGEFKKGLGVIQIDKNKLPYCMTAFEEYRTEWLQLPDLDAVRITLVSSDIELEPKEKVVKRYGDFPTLSRAESEGLSPLKQQALIFLKQAKATLKKDKHLIPYAFLMTTDGRMTIVNVAHDDYEDKYLIWESVAKVVERNRATSIITIGEMWGTPYDSDKPELRPHESPKRYEVIHVAALSKDGEAFSIIVPFFRRWGKIYCKNEMFNHEDNGLHYLMPVLRVWGRQ